MQFGWIHFDESVKESLELDEDTDRSLDELGLSSITNSFSNYFFPGITTSLGRAKYFILIPEILRNYIYEKSPKNDYFMKEQYDITNKLAENSDVRDGIIGIRNVKNDYKENWITSTPIDRYWSALREYGFFKNPNKYTRYSLDNFKADVEELKKNGKKEDIILEKLVDWKFFPKKVDSNSIRLNQYEKEILQNKLSNRAPKKNESELFKYLLKIKDEIDFQKFYKTPQGKIDFQKFYEYIQDKIPSALSEIKNNLKLAVEYNKFYHVLIKGYIYLIMSDNSLNKSDNPYEEEFKKSHKRFAANNIESFYKKLSESLFFQEATPEAKKFIESCKNNWNKPQNLLNTIEIQERTIMSSKGLESKIITNEGIPKKESNDFRLSHVIQIIDDLK